MTRNGYQYASDAWLHLSSGDELTNVRYRARPLAAYREGAIRSVAGGYGLLPGNGRQYAGQV
jgi:hypothetical protein